MINRTIMTPTPFILIHAVGSLFAAAGGAGFRDGFLDRFTGFAGALLNAAQQFFLLAFGELEIVIRKLGPLLFELTLSDVPVAFDFEFVHSALLCFLFLFLIAAMVTAKVLSQSAYRPRLRQRPALFHEA
jgi:hypothetical protein